MKKYEIVKKNTDFNDIIKTGAYFKNKYVYIYYKDSDYSYSRFGLAVSKKCGDAVERNKIKRQLRMIIDSHKELFLRKDYIIMPRKEYLSLDFKDREEALISCMMKGTKNEKSKD